MRVVLIAVTGGSIAHTLRPLPVAMRLRQLGARVLFGGQGPYLKFVAEKGFPVVPFPMLDYAPVLKMMDSERFHLRGISEYRTAVCSQRAHLEAIQPDVVLQDGPDHALPLAALEAGIGHINLENATVLGLAGGQSVLPYRPWIRKAVGRSKKWSSKINSALILQRNLRINFSALVYLAERGISIDQIPQFSLIPDLPELFNARTDIAEKIFIGPLLYDPDPPRPEWWNRLDSTRPLIYVGVGSSGGTKGMQTMIAALANTEYQVVLSTSGAFDAGNLPDNFFAARMVPLTSVLQKASGMVFHGGTSTTYMGIKFAVPMVAIPAHFDHEMNARALAARGLGISIFPHELTADRLRDAVKSVMSSTEIARNLKRFQYILAMRRPAEHGADLVLELARRKQPNTRHRNEIDGLQVQPVAMANRNPAVALRTLRRLAPINRQSRILVIGCGDGEFAQYIIERVGCEIVCTEENPSLLRRARSRGLWVKDVTIGELSEDDKEFDLILTNNESTAASISAGDRLSVKGRIVFWNETEPAGIRRYKLLPG